jgi:BASS family bile acid:Na+ symporter
LKKIISIIKNRNFIFVLSIVLGLVISNVPEWIKYLTVPALAIVMTVSLSQIPLQNFLDVKKITRPVLYSLLFNYLIFGVVMLVMARFLISDRELWIGFVILAVAPPGVAIPPFTYIIGGDEKFSIVGLVGAYIASLGLIPIAGLVFIGRNFVKPLDLIILFLELIAAPLVVSQLLIKFKIAKYVTRWRGPIVNWGLFIVIFVVISLNREIFFSDFRTVALLSLISAITIFGLWLLLSIVLKKLRFKESVRRSLILMGIIKNSGFAAATALALFGYRTSLPGAIFSIFLIIFLIIIPVAFKKKNAGKTSFKK